MTDPVQARGLDLPESSLRKILLVVYLIRVPILFV